MSETLLSIDRCLFDAFTNADFNNPQAKQQMWAIREGLARASAGTEWEWRQ